MDNAFPVEIILRIICFLGPLDVVQLRKVSKKLRDITYDPLIWKTIYESAPLPRPPGPFPFQSTHFLESTLVQSAQLAKSWTTQPISEVSRTWEVDGEGIVARVICGRGFLTLTTSQRQIVLCDIDSGSVRQVVWELEDAPLVSRFAWDACSMTSPDGQRVYLLLCEDKRLSLHHPATWSFKLLEFQMNEDSGDLSHCASLNVPHSATDHGGAISRFARGKAPFLHFTHNGLVFDTRTRSFYRFPWNSSDSDISSVASVLLTPTHILTFHRSSRPGTSEPSTLIQAYEVPSNSSLNDNGPGTLRLTHVGFMPKPSSPISLLRNAISDPTNGSIKTRILVQHTESYHHLLSCAEFTLPGSTTDAVSTISVDIHDSFPTGMPISPPYPTDVFIDASDDGRARGMCAKADHRVEGGRHFEFSIVKFTIDAAGDKCVAIVGEPLVLEWDHLRMPCLSYQAVFDGIRGRLYAYRYERRDDDQRGCFVVRSKVL